MLVLPLSLPAGCRLLLQGRLCRHSLFRPPLVWPPPLKMEHTMTCSRRKNWRQKEGWEGAGLVGDWTCPLPAALPEAPGLGGDPSLRLEPRSCGKQVVPAPLSLHRDTKG